MQAINDYNYTEYHFLSSCYNEGLSDKKVYSLFVKKVLSEIDIPATYTFNNLQKYILEKNKIEIPPTFIKEIVKDLSKEHQEITIKGDSTTIKILPEAIKNQISVQQNNADNDTRLIFEEFNSHLETVTGNKINYHEFNTAFQIYCNLILKKDITHTIASSKMTDWIYITYKTKTNKKLIEALDKWIYSWLLYNYFYSVKRQHKSLNGFQIILDTNVLSYLLNINGIDRKLYVEYLLSKIKTNNCSVMINDFTIKELNLLLDSDNLIVKIFNNEYPEARKQIKFNSQEYLKALFSNYDITVKFNSSSAIDMESKYYKEISTSLRTYKSLKRPVNSEYSIQHDILLIHCLGNLKKITNIYSERKLIGTCDIALCNWLESYMLESLDSNYTNLISLDKLNLIFWIESDKANVSEFLSNTWMFITETENYFKDKSVDDYFKNLRDKYMQNQNVPENWRSLYLLIDKASNKEVYDIEIDEFEKILDSINTTILGENNELKNEVIDLRSELEKLKLEVSQTNQKPVIQQNFNTLNYSAEKKTLEDYKISELFLFILKKILAFFFNRKQD